MTSVKNIAAELITGKTSCQRMLRRGIFSVLMPTYAWVLGNHLNLMKKKDRTKINYAP